MRGSLLGPWSERSQRPVQSLCGSAGRFFESAGHMEAGRKMPTEAAAYARMLPLAPSGALAADPGRMEGNTEQSLPASVDPDTVPSPPASAGPDVVAPALEAVGRWTTVLLRSWTAIVTGPQSAFLAFNFVPEWLDGAAPGTLKQRFEGFIVALFTLVGCQEGQAPWMEGAVRAPN